MLIAVHAQPKVNQSDSIPTVSNKSLQSFSEKSDRLQRKISGTSTKALSKIEKLESKLFKKLAEQDSLQAKQLAGKAQAWYGQMENSLKNVSEKVKPDAVYIPWLDSVATTLKFLEKIKEGQGINGLPDNNIKQYLGKIDELQNVLNRSNNLGSQLAERKEWVLREMNKLGMVKSLKKYQATVYYYQAQVKEYKELLNRPDELIAKSIHLLQKIPAFNEFYQRNSVLSTLFRMPSSDPNDPAYLQSLAGLQTRNSVGLLVQQRIGGTTPQSAQQQLNQFLQQGQSAMQQLRAKMEGLKQSKEPGDLPTFKPNDQKTKSFFNRIEYGFNIQTQRATSYYPVGSDIALSAGYRINDRSVVGFGMSYLVSWGNDFKHLKITQKGVGFRSFLDWKIKGGLWVSGGYEMNYHFAFSSVRQLRQLDVWQQSGLIGVSKKIPLKSKPLKSTKIQLLWDFLSYHQVPRANPIVFRIGYGF
jgi:hypothetical protein